MEKLDREATKGPWISDDREWNKNAVLAVIGTGNDEELKTEPIVVTDSGVYPPEKPDSEWIARTRTELPRAVMIIKENDLLINNLLQIIREVDNLHEGLADTRLAEHSYRIEKILGEGK